MIHEQYSRTALLIGEEALKRLGESHVAVFGIGGVGGYVVEALARSGIGCLTLVDSDTVELSNLNRQIIATHHTLGQYKTDVMKERILSINPSAKVLTRNCFYLPENADTFDLNEYSYIVDAIDTVTAKLELIVRAQKDNVPIISSMGTGGKLDPSMLKIGDVYETSVDPLARIMRRELRKRGVKKLPVVYSTEEPVRIAQRTPGSTAFVPPAAGLLIASYVVRELIKTQNER